MVGGDSECREIGALTYGGGDSEYRELETWGAQTYGGGDSECREMGGTDIWWGETVSVERWGRRHIVGGRQ